MWLGPLHRAQRDKLRREFRLDGIDESNRGGGVMVDDLRDQVLEDLVRLQWVIV
jgi:hypothetical protein